MPGWNNATNKFGPSQFIVGPILGDGVNYTSIQTAINDATAAGGGTVIIRAGVYVESFSMAHNVSVVGAPFDGSNTVTSIVGSVTVGFNGNSSINALNVVPAAGVALIINGVASGQLEIFNCQFTGGPASAAMSAASAAISVSCRESTFVGNGANPNCSIQLDNSVFENCFFNGGSSFIVSAGNPITVSRSRSSGCSMETSAGTTLILQHSFVSSGADAALIIAGGSQVFATNTVLESQDAGGLAVQGAGSFAYADITMGGTAIGIQGTISRSPQDWQQYASAIASPGLPAANIGSRGTSAFDSAQFSVTNGFVQLSAVAVPTTFTTDSGVATPVANNINILGGPGVTTSALGDTITVNSVEWTDTIGPLTVTRDSGSFDQATGTLTLPAAPTQGEECRFFSINSPSVIQANAGQTIQIGNQTSSLAGTATGADTGDSLFLVFYAAGNRWCSIATNGNWVLT